MGDTVSKNSIDRLERFHSLLAGQYWTSTDSIPEEGIVAGDTLLITSLRYVEDKLHTVILRAHPAFTVRLLLLSLKTAVATVGNVAKKCESIASG